MSAFQVSKAHIDVLVWANMRYNLFSNNRYEVDDIGKMLVKENLRSLAARYPNAKDYNSNDFSVKSYTYTKPKREYSIVEIIKAIECYEYQTCETDDFETTPAGQFCRSLMSAMIARLPGYDEAAWDIKDE